MKKVEKSFIDIHGERWPVKIYREYRNSYRASVGKDALILRLPFRQPFSADHTAWSWFRAWAEKLVLKNSLALRHLRIRSFEQGEEIEVGLRSYRLHLILETRQSHTAKLQADGSILVKLADHVEKDEHQRAIKNLLGKVVAKDFLPIMTQRVHQINNEYFKMPIKGVKLKQNFSNWGSCSRHGNINLSTRLLFAPQPVIDYVIIHELAHLKEFNHSDRFWNIVGDVMPDYEQKERWLKENFHACDF